MKEVINTIARVYAIIFTFPLYVLYQLFNFFGTMNIKSYMEWLKS